MKLINIHLRINGKEVVSDVPADLSLADFLHEKIGLTGTKVSCGIGICKACTVAGRVPGDASLQRLQACITPVAALNGYSLTTVEGLASGNALSPQQQAVLKHFSFQCGYCAPGFLMGITLLMDRLKRDPVKKSDLHQVILDNMGDHICRCSGYVKYYEAIKALLINTPGLVLMGA